MIQTRKICKLQELPHVIEGLNDDTKHFADWDVWVTYFEDEDKQWYCQFWDEYPNTDQIHTAELQTHHYFRKLKDGKAA